MLLAQRVIEWNRARYNQEFDYDLAVNLLLEETDELLTAGSKVKMLDAIGDITFVALGVFWKIGIPDAKINLYFHDQPLIDMDARQAFDFMNHIQIDIANILDASAEEDASKYVAANLACHSLFGVALGSLRGMGMQYSFYEILGAICDSNDTKDIKGKTPANVKANVVKGMNYVPPTAALLRIEEQHQALRKLNRTMQ